MNTFSQLMKRCGNSIQQGWRQSLLLLGLLSVLMQKLGTALYRQLRDDLQIVYQHLHRSSKNLQGQPISSWSDAKQLALHWFSKLKPAYFYPLLVARKQKLRQAASTEWQAFQADVQKIRERFAQFRNPTQEQRAVAQLSPFSGEQSTIIASSIVINILALAFPLLMLQLYDRILPHWCGAI